MMVGLGVGMVCNGRVWLLRLVWLLLRWWFLLIGGSFGLICVR